MGVDTKMCPREGMQMADMTVDGKSASSKVEGYQAAKYRSTVDMVHK
jgi:hypothetical protein